MEGIEERAAAANVCVTWIISKDESKSLVQQYEGEKIMKSASTGKSRKVLSIVLSLLIAVQTPAMAGELMVDEEIAVSETQTFEENNAQESMTVIGEENDEEFLSFDEDFSSISNDEDLPSLDDNKEPIVVGNDYGFEESELLSEQPSDDNSLDADELLVYGNGEIDNQTYEEDMGDFPDINDYSLVEPSHCGTTDTIAPELISINRDKTRVTVNETVTYTMEIKDEGESGVGFSTIGLMAPNGTTKSARIKQKTETEYYAEFIVDATWLSGNYTLSYVNIYDNAENHLIDYNVKSKFPETGFEVYDTTTDTIAPELISINRDKTRATVNETVTYTMEIKDEGGSGVGFSTIGLMTPNGTTKSTRIKQKTETEYYAEFIVDATWLSGNYTLSYVNIYDNAENHLIDYNVKSKFPETGFEVYEPTDPLYTQNIEIILGGSQQQTFYLPHNWTSIRAYSENEKVAGVSLAGVSNVSENGTLKYGRIFTVEGLTSGTAVIDIYESSTWVAKIIVNVIPDKVTVRACTGFTHEINFTTSYLENFSIDDQGIALNQKSCKKTTSTITINGYKRTVVSYEYTYEIKFNIGGAREELFIIGDKSGKVLKIETLDHIPTVDYSVKPTCIEDGLTEGSHCALCNEVIVAQERIPALGHVEVTDKAVVPTCTKTGLTEGSHCSVCGEVIVAQEVVPVSHKRIIDSNAIPPTCTETGLTEASHCSICGKIIKQEIIPATGHKWGEWVITKKPSFNETGHKERKCENCDKKEQEEIPRIIATINLSATEITLLPDQSKRISVTGLATGDKVASWASADTSIATVSSIGRILAVKPGMTTVTVVLESGLTADVKVTVERKLFDDVTDPSLFYYDPIYWAVDNNITTGYTDNTFRPNNNCNRAAVVTFLWRLAGKPDMGITNAFSDMTGNDDFDHAITWAAANGITTGYNDGTFRPWDTCHRAAIVTFLWRYAGRPEPNSMANFSDMTGNTDFNKAISWAAEKNITTGYKDGTFRPYNQCLRLAVATFLYRYANL